MLTETEMRKLEDNHDARVRDKSNDFIVRKKFTRWLDELDFVFNIILRYLPEKQTKKIITHHHIIQISNILLHVLSMMSVPMFQKSAHEYIAVVPYNPPRPATNEEIMMMNDFIKPLIQGLFRKLSDEEARNVIQTELNRNQPEYILVKRAFDEYPNLFKEDPPQ